MEIKKNPEVDLRNYRTLFSAIGLVVALGFTLGLLYYTRYDKKGEATVDYEYNEDEMDVEQTVQEPEQQRPEPQPPTLEIAEDDEILPDQPDLEDTEDDEDAYVPPPPPPPDDIDNSGEIYESWDVSKKAAFKGNLNEFIVANLVYPQQAIDEGLEGKVTVEFVVEADGTIKRSSIKILSRPHGLGLEEEAIKVVLKMSGMWAPAEQREKPVRMRFRMPIRYDM